MEERSSMKKKVAGLILAISLGVISLQLGILPVIAVLILAINIFSLKPAYAYYNITHLHLTKMAIQKLERTGPEWDVSLAKGGPPYSCLKELKKFQGEESAELVEWDEDLNPPPLGKPGLIWGSYMEDYLGEHDVNVDDFTSKVQGKIRHLDISIVLEHFYNPKTGQGLTDFSGPVPDWMVKFTKPAVDRAQEHWERGKRAYEQGRIRDAYTFLGRVIHLLEDMATPSHVRNDGHVKGHWCSYEQWCDGTKLFTHTSDGRIYRLPPNPRKKKGTIIQKLSTWNPPCKTIDSGQNKRPKPQNALFKLVQDEVDVRNLMHRMATRTSQKWLSDDTIPGNDTAPNIDKKDLWGKTGKEVSVDNYSSIDVCVDHGYFRDTSQEGFIFSISNLFWGRRGHNYRLKTNYLRKIAEDVFPIVVNNAALLIQRFYESVQHVKLRSEHEAGEPKRGSTLKFRSAVGKPSINLRANTPGIIRLENCGGVPDDFILEIEGNSEDWEIIVEGLSGCEGVKVEEKNRRWRIINVEPTPTEIVEDTRVESEMDYHIYDQPFNGKRGARLKITFKIKNA